MSDGPEWFAPKRFGFGAGVPIAWQGWMVVAVYAAIVVAAVHWLADTPIALLGVIVPASAILTLITARTTRGGWHWRWGGQRGD